MVEFQRINQLIILSFIIRKNIGHKLLKRVEINQLLQGQDILISMDVFIKIKLNFRQNQKFKILLKKGDLNSIFSEQKKQIRVVLNMEIIL